jgi:hypothetical protein
MSRDTYAHSRIRALRLILAAGIAALGALTFVPLSLASGGCGSFAAGYGGSGSVQSFVSGYGGAAGKVQGSIDCTKKAGTLPFTGFDLRFIAVAAILLLLVGIVLRMKTRRNTSS